MGVNFYCKAIKPENKELVLTEIEGEQNKIVNYLVFFTTIVQDHRSLTSYCVLLNKYGFNLLNRVVLDSFKRNSW